MATKQRFEPDEFEPDEAWIVFRLNSAPIGTRRDGEFNCVAVMDAATLLIHSMEMVPAASAGPTCAQASALLAKACGTSGRFPAKLMLSSEDSADEVAVEARHRGIEVVRTPARSLSRFTREAREAFSARFGGTPS